jgi:hypothetical protein
MYGKTGLKRREKSAKMNKISNFFWRGGGRMMYSEQPDLSGRGCTYRILLARLNHTERALKLYAQETQSHRYYANDYQLPVNASVLLLFTASKIESCHIGGAQNAIRRVLSKQWCCQVSISIRRTQTTSLPPFKHCSQYRFLKLHISI